jgi:RDD family
VFHTCYAWLGWRARAGQRRDQGGLVPVRRGTGRYSGCTAAGPASYRIPVSERRWAAWLPGSTPVAGDESYPGARFGLPEHGSRSVAGMGRRLAALFIDWILCMVIGLAFFHARGWVTLAVFTAEVYVLTALTGFTVGKRLLGIRVARLDGQPVGFLWALVRTALLLTVLPPLISDRDLRGLHDRAANTIVIRA